MKNLNTNYRFNNSTLMVLILVSAFISACEKEDMKVSTKVNEISYNDRVVQPNSLLFRGLLVYDSIDGTWQCIPGPTICFMVVFKETYDEADFYVPDENNSFEESIPNPIGVLSFNSEETEMTHSEIEDVLTFDQINDSYTAYTIDTVDNVSYLNTLIFTLDM